MADKEVEEYATNFNNIVCGGFITIAVGLGTKLGLIEALKSFSEPADIKTIAGKTNLKERYVREWLGCMVASKIVCMEGDDKYYIPEKCKDSLGMAWYAPFPAIMGSREICIEEIMNKNSDKVLNAYDCSTTLEFFDMLDKERLACIDDRLEKGVLPILKKYQENFDEVLELGCGTGIFVNGLAKRYPESTVTGIDLTEAAINKAKANAERQNISNSKFFSYDVSSLPDDWEGKFDLVLTFDVLHDLPNPDAAIKEMKRVLTQDGIIIIIDPKLSSHHKKNIGNMLAGAFLAISIFNCLPNSLSSGEAAGLGCGWGYEKEEAFLKSQNLKILESSDFTINEMSIAFVCKKNDISQTVKPYKI